jgi:hypothetical protein
VVGAIIDLRNCCNLLDSRALDEVATAHKAFTEVTRSVGGAMPTNVGATPDRLGRYLDRAVIEFMHGLRTEVQAEPYDTVRAAFPEGGDLYPGAGFTKRAHIQIAVRNPACIKGYFHAIKSDD